jgi:phage shock protein A
MPQDAEHMARIERIIRMVDEVRAELDQYVGKYSQLQGEMLMLESGSQDVQEAIQLSTQLAQLESDYLLLIAIKHRIEAYRMRMGL